MTDTVDAVQPVDQRTPKAIDAPYHQAGRSTGFDPPYRALKKRAVPTGTGFVHLLEDLQQADALPGGPPLDRVTLNYRRDEPRTAPLAYTADPDVSVDPQSGRRRDHVHHADTQRCAVQIASR